MHRLYQCARHRRSNVPLVIDELASRSILGSRGQYSNPGPMPPGLLRLCIVGYIINSISSSTGEQQQAQLLLLPSSVDWLSINNKTKPLLMHSLSTNLVRLSLEGVDMLESNLNSVLPSLQQLRCLGLVWEIVFIVSALSYVVGSN